MEEQIDLRLKVKRNTSALSSAWTSNQYKVKSIALTERRTNQTLMNWLKHSTGCKTENK